MKRMITLKEFMKWPNKLFSTIKKGLSIFYLHIFKIERHEVEHSNIADGELQTIVQRG